MQEQISQPPKSVRKRSNFRIVVPCIVLAAAKDIMEWDTSTGSVIKDIQLPK
jgi:hypothetical protein